MKLNIRLNLTDKRVRIYLLEGLNRWVELGLISAEQQQAIFAELDRASPSADSQPAGITDFLENEPVARAELRQSTGSAEAREQVAAEFTQSKNEPDTSVGSAAVQTQTRPNWASQAVASLIEEISVIWLLFLGVFLVVVSSGVLAASQWDSFSAVGQYGILFAYTLAFWGASVWTQRREMLQTTGRMLALTTMLLIPVNFWVMDRFGVLGSPLGIGLGFVAAIALTIFPLGLSAELMPRRTNRINLIGLSWLHWGWGWAIWPVIATYFGTIGSAANLTYQDRQSEASRPRQIGSAEDNLENDDSQQAKGLSFDVLTVALSIVILLVRSLWIAQVPPYRLGLAAGICGWLLVWLTRHKASQIVWERAGFGLLLLGWAVSVSQQPPLQAIAISILAVGLLWNKLKETWKRIYLFAVLGVGLQTYGLLWSILPTTLRDRLLTWLSTWFDVGIVERVNWAGIGLFPFLLGTLLFAAYLRRKEQQTLSQISERLTLGFGFVLALMSVGNPFTCAVNLLLSTATLSTVLWKRRLQPNNLVTLAHGVMLLTIVSWIHYFAPELSTASWAKVALGVAIAEGIGHVYLRQTHLQLNAWWGTCGLSAVSYLLLIDSYSQNPNWLWLIVPILFTAIANHRRALHPKIAVGITMVALLMQLPWMTAWPISIISLGIGSLCMGANSRIWRSPFTAFFTVGTGLSLISSVAWVGLIRPMDHSLSRLMILSVIEIWALWLAQRNLSRRTQEMAQLYKGATRIWGAVLMVAFLSWGTGVVTFCLLTPLILDTATAVHLRYLLASNVILIAAIAECTRSRPMEWRYWSLAWATEIAVALGLILSQSVGLPAGELPLVPGPFTLVKVEAVAIATLALAFSVQIAGDIWIAIKRTPYRRSWHYIPLAYAGLGLLLGHFSFQADTGFFSLAAGLLLLGIGRRKHEFKHFSYAGLAAITFGAYELLVYQLLQASGGSEGDGVTLLAILALAFTAAYRGLKRWGPRYLKITPRALGIANHAHWAVGSVLCIAAPAYDLSQPKGIALWTGCSLLLCGYALSVGNRRWTPNTFLLKYNDWTWIGLAGTLLCIAYDRFVWFPDRAGLFTWGSAIACILGFALYYTPWERFGWSEPWRTTGLWLPVLTLSITIASVQTQGLLIVAAFYAWMAKQTSRIRLSYVSVILFDLALLDYLDIHSWLTPMTLSLVGGLSVLYVAEIDPYFRQQSQRQQRHWLRVLASGLVGVTALYQTEVSQPMLIYAAIAVLLGIAFIFAGLILKVRAFLYVGTATFIAQIIRVLWLFINANSLLLWAVGIVLGLLFIWVAATFESRRSQVTSQLSSWTSALEAWD